jgi:methylamine utilization protein MauE
MVTLMLDPVFEIALRGTAACLLLAAAWHKLRNPIEFWQALSAYQLLNEKLARPVSRTLPVAEAGIALSLIVFSASALPVIAALLLWAAYGAAIAINLLRGRTEMKCGCGGIGADQSIHWGLVARNGVLVICTSLLLLPASGRVLAWLDIASGIFAIGLLAFLYAATEHLLRNAALLDHKGTHP